MQNISLNRGKVIAFSAAIALGLLALLPGTWGSALAQTSGTPSATPDTVTIPTTEFVFDGGDAAPSFEVTPTISLQIPAGALPDGTTITVGSVDTNPADLGLLASDLAGIGITSLPPAAEDGGFVLSVFNIDALTGDEEAFVDGPVTMTFDLTPEQLAAAGGDANNAKLQFWDTEATPAGWTQVTCSGSGSTVTCTLPHFSTWALTIEVADADGVGEVPAPADTGTGLTGDAGGSNVAWLVAALAAVAVVGGAGARLVMGRARR